MCEKKTILCWLRHSPISIQCVEPPSGIMPFFKCDLSIDAFDFSGAYKLGMASDPLEREFGAGRGMRRWLAAWMPRSSELSELDAGGFSNVNRFLAGCARIEGKDRRCV